MGLCEISNFSIELHFQYSTDNLKFYTVIFLTDGVLGLNHYVYKDSHDITLTNLRIYEH